MVSLARLVCPTSSCNLQALDQSPIHFGRPACGQDIRTVDDVHHPIFVVPEITSRLHSARPSAPRQRVAVILRGPRPG